MSESREEGLYLLLISIHGLIRGDHLELGRDPDTGGQIQYAVELTKALAADPAVDRVDLLTRQVFDPRVNPDYAEPQEEIADGAFIIRLPCGPRRYLRKELLWPHLDAFIDNALQHARRVGRTPDVIHSHYADSGYVGARLSQLMGVPLIHTGHSLGRVKLERLLASGMAENIIESQYNISQRIEAEEIALGNASLVVASTNQEVEEQYSQYENYHPKRMVVIPPGVDLSRFRPPRRADPEPAYAAEINRFLRYPRKPMILALSRADERKNIATLVRAYGENRQLRDAANLVIVAGNRDDIEFLEKGPKEVLKELLLMIDRYDLYGSTAYPKHHKSTDIPELYRLAAKVRGLFVNPALTEPFGLTLIEAAASGLPLVATEDGGPNDIINHCNNGLLIDPLDADELGAKLLDALGDRERWQRWSKSGLSGVRRYYSWKAHVKKYLRELQRVKRRFHKPVIRSRKSRLPAVDRILVSDIDNTLIGDREGLEILLQRLQEADGRIGFGIATGRHLNSALKVMKEWDIPKPDLLITSVGSELHYGAGLVEDLGWQRHIDYLWKPEALREALANLPGLKLQAKINQRRFKISYNVTPDSMLTLQEIRTHLRKLDLHARLIYSHQAYLDVLPVRASKGMAVRYLAMRWGVPPDCLLVAGDSGNDEEMLSGNTLGVVVGNYSPELEPLRNRPRIYFAGAGYAHGIVEGMDHYGFLNAACVPEYTDQINNNIGLETHNEYD